MSAGCRTGPCFPHLKKQKHNPALTVGDLKNASVQWRDYHRGSERYSFFLEEKKNESSKGVDDKYMSGG